MPFEFCEERGAACPAPWHLGCLGATCGTARSQLLTAPASRKIGPSQLSRCSSSVAGLVAAESRLIAVV
jgi:hypothetical protein